jgi:hypothetical protein
MSKLTTDQVDEIKSLAKEMAEAEAQEGYEAEREAFVQEANKVFDKVWESQKALINEVLFRKHFAELMKNGGTL